MKNGFGRWVAGGLVTCVLVITVLVMTIQPPQAAAFVKFAAPALGEATGMVIGGVASFAKSIPTGQQRVNPTTPPAR